jgi:hypothetical protein
MTAIGLKQTVMTVRFLPGEPDTIQGKAFLDKAVPEATGRGLKVVFAMYPYPPRALMRTQAEVKAFADYVAVVARTYPSVQQFVIGNEPNQPAFWRPQLSKAGVALSARSFGRYLAAAYDTLKEIDPDIHVVGVGLSPRGNDNAAARNNLSTSPVRFLGALGAWYRRSGRTEPLMDGLAFHLYPRAATDALLRRYDWPNAGYADLGRVKQAFWDAFHDTAQPTTVEGLQLYLNEAGWQVNTAGYEGTRARERTRHDGEEAGGDLCRARAPRLVRRRRRRGELLRVLRRRDPRFGLPGGAAPGQRHPAPGSRRGCEGDRAHPVAPVREAVDVGACHAGQRRRGAPRAAPGAVRRSGSRRAPGRSSASCGQSR